MKELQGRREGTAEFYHQLLVLVLPIAFQQFMLALVSASDAWMLGLLHQDALGAVSLAGQVAFVENLFLGAMTIGFSMLAAQYWGKGDLVSVEKIFAFVMRITLVIALVFFVAGVGFPGLLMRILTNDATLIAYGSLYLRIVAPSYLLVAASQIYLCMLKNSKKAGKASLISSASVVVNIGLNAVLIFGLFGFPRLEVAGAALATVLAKILELLWCMGESRRKNSVKLRKPFFFHSDKQLARDFWHYSTKVLGNQLAWGVGISAGSAILGHLGNDAVAANSISVVVKNLIVCFCLGIGNGGGIILGNALGSGNLELAREYGRRLSRLSVFCGLITAGVLLLLRPLIVSVAGLEPLATAYLEQMLLVCAVYVFGKSVNATCVVGIFCSGGDSAFGFRCDIITLWCIVVPLGLLSAFVFRLPILAVYIIVTMDEIIKIPAVYRNYKKYRWVKDLTVKGDAA